MELIGYGEIPVDVARANALLIAAAPEMYSELESAEMLIRIFANLGYSGSEELRARADSISAVLNKAVNGTPRVDRHPLEKMLKQSRSYADAKKAGSVDQR
jgi:hypothetical protein